MRADDEGSEDLSTTLEEPTRTGPSLTQTDVPGKRARIVSVALAVFFGFYLFIGFSKGEAFPFSTFPMYSVARLDPYVVPSQRIFAYTAGGQEHAVTDQSIRGRVRAMRREIVLDEVGPPAIAAFADEMVRRINAERLTPEPVVGIRVMELKMQLRLRGAGDPLKPEVVSSTVLIDAAPEGARFSSRARPSEDSTAAADTS